MAKTLMVQGTASSAGKSILVTALCRIFKQDGLRVAPFKSQNMSLNSFVTRDGGEIGRAQVVQAEAAGIEPTVDMNPILLKPEAEARSQVIVLGKPATTLAAVEYYQRKAKLLGVVEESLARLQEAYDVVVIEGAGSAAEVNLRDSEIVNMRIAKLAHAPVLLVGDIDRGGVFASLVGTLELLDPDERDLIKGLVINKFRGDISLLKSGLDFLETRTGKPVLGVIPFFRDIAIAQEDSVYLEDRLIQSTEANSLDIAIFRLPRIANFDDFDPLGYEPDARIRYVDGPQELGRPDLLVIPGTKSTLADLAFIHESGLARAILSLVRQGTPIVGICGGYQMLGKKITDPFGVESPVGEMAGLGLLDVETEFAPEKTTSQVTAVVTGDRGLLAGSTGETVDGYEIHMGQTRGRSDLPAFDVVGVRGQRSGVSGQGSKDSARKFGDGGTGPCPLSPVP
ncbi:MAG: cobyric acid synthase, partial [Chloroflexi bacterium]|nr:cobyric acid synthase [Chloroflexota bacterium]